MVSCGSSPRTGCRLMAGEYRLAGGVRPGLRPWPEGCGVGTAAADARVPHADVVRAAGEVRHLEAAEPERLELDRESRPQRTARRSARSRRELAFELASHRMATLLRGQDGPSSNASSISSSMQCRWPTGTGGVRWCRCRTSASAASASRTAPSHGDVGERTRKELQRADHAAACCRRVPRLWALEPCDTAAARQRYGSPADGGVDGAARSVPAFDSPPPIGGPDADLLIEREIPGAGEATDDELRGITEGPTRS